MVIALLIGAINLDTSKDSPFLLVPLLIFDHLMSYCSNSLSFIRNPSRVSSWGMLNMWGGDGLVITLSLLSRISKSKTNHVSFASFALKKSSLVKNINSRCVMSQIEYHAQLDLMENQLKYTFPDVEPKAP